jgi:hypothetical protein
MKPVINYSLDPPQVEVRFSDAPVEYEFAGDVIADVNTTGNWVRGLELLGSGSRFSLGEVLRTLNPERPGNAPGPQPELRVTYDPEADAAYLYLPYAASLEMEREHVSNPGLFKSAYSVEDDEATFGLAPNKSLVVIRFRVPAAERIEDFMRFFGNRGRSTHSTDF